MIAGPGRDLALDAGLPSAWAPLDRGRSAESGTRFGTRFAFRPVRSCSRGCERSPSTSGTGCRASSTGSYASTTPSPAMRRGRAVGWTSWSPTRARALTGSARRTPRWHTSLSSRLARQKGAKCSPQPSCPVNGHDSTKTRSRRMGTPFLTMPEEVSGFTTHVPGDRSLMSRDIGRTLSGRRGQVLRRSSRRRERSECRSGDRRARLVRGWANSRGHVPSSRRRPSNRF
jgi:hypothetical protein